MPLYPRLARTMPALLWASSQAAARLVLRSEPTPSPLSQGRSMALSLWGGQTSGPSIAGEKSRRSFLPPSENISKPAWVALP